MSNDPAGVVDAALLGQRTLILTARSEGQVRLRLVGADRSWTIPVVVVSDRFGRTPQGAANGGAAESQVLQVLQESRRQPETLQSDAGAAAPEPSTRKGLAGASGPSGEQSLAPEPRTTRPERESAPDPEPAPVRSICAPAGGASLDRAFDEDPGNGPGSPCDVVAAPGTATAEPAAAEGMSTASSRKRLTISGLAHRARGRSPGSRATSPGTRSVRGRDRVDPVEPIPAEQDDGESPVSTVFGPWHAGIIATRPAAEGPTLPAPDSPARAATAGTGEGSSPTNPERVPQLTGILRTGSGSAAILDGRPVGTGEQIGFYRIDRIEGERVILKRGDRWLELTLPSR